MAEPAWWAILALPFLLGAAAAGAFALDAALAARTAGRPMAAATVAPARAAARLLVQQPRSTRSADVLLRRVGVTTVPVAALSAGLVLPLGDRAVVDLDVGIVWFNAMEILAWAAVWMVGWGPNAPFSLVGGYRFLAQGLAYELPHMFALIGAATAAESLRVGAVVERQGELWFAVWLPVAFAVFLISAAAMAFWGPFGAPLGAEIGGGAAGELAAADRLVFLGGRWLLITVAAAMSVPLFLGGGTGPLLPGWAWTAVKTAAVLAVMVWAARRVPTVRMDRFAEFAWLVLIPLTLLQALLAALVVLGR